MSNWLGLAAAAARMPCRAAEPELCPLRARGRFEAFDSDLPTRDARAPRKRFMSSCSAENRDSGADSTCPPLAALCAAFEGHLFA